MEITISYCGFDLVAIVRIAARHIIKIEFGRPRLLTFYANIAIDQLKSQVDVQN